LSEALLAPFHLFLSGAALDVAERYKLLDKIGEGSFAVVFRAQDLELGREVAIKQIQPQFLADSIQTERYWREANLLASFQHPRIVTIYDVARERGWLILELMQANLRDRLQGRPMDLKAVQTTLTQALRALSALHARGIVHGDVKPSNLMIDHRKRIKVGDFGLARRVSHDEGSVIRGTAKYMAPETLSPDFGDVGPHSDLYSLGFTAYELLCGSKFESLFPGLDAFGRDRQAAWMMWHAAPDRRLPELSKALAGVPPQLAKVVSRLVEKDLKNRYATADEALVDLGAPPTESSVQIAAADRSSTPAPPAKPHRRLVIALFTISMMLSAAMLFWPAEKPTAQPLTSKPVFGVLRAFDPATNTIEIEDTVTGQPDEFKLPDKPRIRLIGDGVQDEFILPKRLEAGDWIRLDAGGGRWQLDVSRPLTSEGRITTVDAAGNRITLSIEESRVRDSLTLHVPQRTRIELNDRPATLRDLSAGDRVVVEHLLDPAGKDGRIVSRMQAVHVREVTGTIQQFDPGKRSITISTGRGPQATESFDIAPDAALLGEDGAAASLADLVPGRRVRLNVDAVVRSLTVLPGGTSASGQLRTVSPAARTIEIADKGLPRTIALADRVDVRINQAAADIADLRPMIDTVQLTLQGDGEAARVMAIDASRTPRFDRSVIAIGTTSNQPGSLDSRRNAAVDVRLIADVAQRYYATPVELSPALIDRTRDEVVADLKAKLSILQPHTQAIVVVVGHAVFNDGRLLLGFADFAPEKPATALPLEDLVKILEDSASEQKILILDLERSSPEASTADAVATSLKAIPQTTIIIADGDQRSDSANDPVASAVSAALSGRADLDRDLVVTADELMAFLSVDASLHAVRWPAKAQ